MHWVTTPPYDHKLFWNRYSGQISLTSVPASVPMLACKIPPCDFVLLKELEKLLRAAVVISVLEGDGPQSGFGCTE